MNACPLNLLPVPEIHASGLMENPQNLRDELDLQNGSLLLNSTAMSLKLLWVGLCYGGKQSW